MGFVLTLGAVWATTGFAWWDCLLQARRTARTLMSGILGASPAERWLELSYGNGAAFALGAGIALVAMVLARPERRRAGLDPWTTADAGHALRHDPRWYVLHGDRASGSSRFPG